MTAYASSWHIEVQWEIGAGGDGAAAANRSGSPNESSLPPRLAPNGRPGSRSGTRMFALDLFLPLLKVDLDRRLVSGIATPETPDRAGEIFGCASSKPYCEQWSAEALAAASGGKSVRRCSRHARARRATGERDHRGQFPQRDPCVRRLADRRLQPCQRAISGQTLASGTPETGTFMTPSGPRLHPSRSTIC